MMSVSDVQVFDPVLLNTFLIRKKRCRVYFHRGTLIWESEGASYSLQKRPKRLLLFVNPYGGKKKGLQIYEKQVKPLFVLAGIETNVIITQRQNHARDTLLNCSFDSIDGVACIGGDGTFAEVFNGLVLRTARDCGVDHNDPDAILPKPFFRVGVIPGGSTDTMAYCFNGTTDIQTAVLYIILGDSTGLDLCSVHSNATLLQYFSSVISYGYLGDVVRDSEKFRWMGPKRYEYSGFKKFMANNGYEGEVTLLADSCSPSSGPKCMENCARCQSHAENEQNKTAQSHGELKTFRGKFFMVSGANVSCACTRSPNGISPFCHLGDGCVDVLIIKHTHLLNNLKLLLRLSSKEKNVFDLPFVEVHRAREFTFRALPAPVSNPEFPSRRLIPGVSVWNCDGEVQWESNIRIRVHCQLLQVFTRRSQESSEETSCGVCSF
ncbi:ceramide kinase isoform X2 [Cryptotermes secundus]|uniref:ceramide kinase isoform X2 n=1 Tax=Cryptotermes secundus TaxID=105785 RepID=UPI000CD7B657|nr:ceramide kinase isoform X2 [Cryptotermes secundus]